LSIWGPSERSPKLPAKLRRTSWLPELHTNPHQTNRYQAVIWYARFEMKLPNGERAIVDRCKLYEYCLNTDHPRGRNKARVFASAGIRQADAEVLRDSLLGAARNADARPGIANPYGQRYIVDFDLVRQARTVRVRSTWIVRIGEDLPRLTSCYVL
jgi:hypothetical protein